MVVHQSSHTKAYFLRVRDCIRPCPIVALHSDSIATTVPQMNSEDASSILIVDDSGHLVGIITEQDVVRRIALRREGGEPVTVAMSHPVQTVAADEYLYRAVVHMRRLRRRHLPVVNGQGHPIGQIQLDDALSALASSTLECIDELVQNESAAGWRATKLAQTQFVSRLLAEHVEPLDIAALISHVNNDLHRRVIDTKRRQVAEELGHNPPLAFCFIVMGSGGRGENLLNPDQDNGMILEDYPDHDHEQVDQYFIRLAKRITNTLNEIGFSYCNGHVMATNPVWRKSLAQWNTQVGFWGRRRGVIARQFSDIFLDFAPVFGDESLAKALRRRTTEMARHNPAYLTALHEEIAGRAVALGWFGRFIREKKHSTVGGRVDLKLGASMVLVSNIRLLALRAGVACTGTRDRITALTRCGVLNNDEAESLCVAFACVVRAILLQQVTDCRAGRVLSGHVDIDSLSKFHRRKLADAMGVIDALRKRVSVDFTADTVGSVSVHRPG